MEPVLVRTVTQPIYEPGISRFYYPPKEILTWGKSFDIELLPWFDVIQFPQLGRQNNLTFRGDIRLHAM